MVEPLVSWPSLSLSSTAMRAMLFACRPCGWPQPAIDLLDGRRIDTRVALQDLVDDVREGLVRPQ